MLRRLVFAVLAASLAVSPVSADKGGKGKGKSKGKEGDAVVVVESDKAGHPVVVFADRDREVVRSYRVETYGRGNCPPGLAKKNRLCMPPGQYKKRYVVGRPAAAPGAGDPARPGARRLRVRGGGRRRPQARRGDPAGGRRHRGAHRLKV
jgi:hypothetical protein